MSELDRYSLQWDSSEHLLHDPTTTRPPASSLLTSLRASPWTFPALSSLAFFTLLLLTYLHAFAASVLTPSLSSATCAATLSDGICSGVAPSAWCELRCPARCSDFWVSSPSAYAVYGGASNLYRGDSKLCRSALHAGLLQDGTGGCVRVRVLPGNATAGYPSPAQPRNGVQALPAPYYPLALLFAPSSAPSCSSQQWPFLAACLGLGLLAFLLLLPAQAYALTTSAVFVYLLFTARGGDPYAILLQGAGCAISTGALLLWVYWVAAGPALSGTAGWGGAEAQAGAAETAASAASAASAAPAAAPPPSPLHALARLAACYLLPLLLAAHMNLFTALVPDFELSPMLLTLPPAALAGVAALLAAALCGVAYQGRLLLQTPGQCAPLALAYSAACAALLLLSLLLRLHTAVHVHHSILALLLLPLTRTPTLPSLALQAVLLGVLLNGLSFWGVAGPWDAALEAPPPAPPCSATAAALGNGSVAVAWPAACAPPPAMLALAANGFLLLTGPAAGLGGSSATLAFPPGANLTLALATFGPDAVLSAWGQPTSVTVL